MTTHEMSRPIAGSEIEVGAVALEAAVAEVVEPAEVEPAEPAEAVAVFARHSESCRSLFS